MLELTAVSLLNGVVYGLLLFMLTSGLTLIFSMMGVLNFAHASVFMLGAYFSFQFGDGSASGPRSYWRRSRAASSAPPSSATGCGACTPRDTWRRSCSRSGSLT